MVAVRERWTFDGWELTEGVARDWAYRAGTDETAPMIGEDTTIPGRAGVIWTPKVSGPLTFSLDFWLQGSDRAAVQAQWNLLMRAMRRRDRLVTVNRTRADGEVLTADVQLVGTIIPQFLSQRVWRATAMFSIPSGCWSSYNTYLMRTDQSDAVFPKTLALTAFEPSTEVMDELTFTLYGPATNMTVYDYTDGVGGHWMRYTGGIPSSGWVKVNSKTWTITDSGFGFFDQARFQYTGNRFLSVGAARPGEVPMIYVTVDADATTATNVEVSGRRAYSS